MTEKLADIVTGDFSAVSAIDLNGSSGANGGYMAGMLGQELELYREKTGGRYIIESLMDTDFYKFTMGQVIHFFYPDVRVKFGFKNRTKAVKLGQYVDEKELKRELDHVRGLRFTKSELHYPRGTNEYEDRMFREPFLQQLADLRLPAYELEIVDGELRLEFEGRWVDTTHWEIPALSIVNELYTRSRMESLTRLQRDRIYATGVQRLADKIEVLKGRPDITFTDFGTRRRFSRDWQDYVVRNLAEELPPSQFLGTSNTHLAEKYDLLPMGTCAHEMEMGLTGVMHGSDDELRATPFRLQEIWEKLYGLGLSIWLTDTNGSGYFFKTAPQRIAEDWKGLRQDSGDPFWFTDKAIDFYRSRGVDPSTKMIVYSDGLEVPIMLRLADYRKGEIRKTFGWGTNLTNDLGIPALSIVIKLMESNGHGTVKLSDNPAKALGKPEDIEHFKRIFGYNDADYPYKEVKY